VRHVLVTGGNGFIGRYVVRELLARGYSPTVMDWHYREPEPGADLVFGDVRDATSVTEAAAHSDGLIHLAGVLGTQETIANPRPAVETNVLGGLNVLEAVAQYGIPAVNIAVGNHWMTNTYSITKHTVERFADMFNCYRNARVSVVRALNAYGPGQLAPAPYGPSRVRKIMPSFICRALSGEPLEVYGDGAQVMDLIHVRDVAAALVATLEYTAAHGPLIDLEAGSGNATTVNDIAQLVAAEVERRGKSVRIDHLPMRPGEEPGAVVLGRPATLAAVGLDVADFMPLDQGIAQTVDYFAEILGCA
jgi:UDP-glucose 4-epimerase